MIKNEVRPGLVCLTKVGARLATVKVVSLADRRGRWACLTADTDQTIYRTAAALRPLPGSPEAAAAAARDADRARKRAEVGARAAAAEVAEELKVYALAAAEFMFKDHTAATLRDHAEAWISRLPSPLARDAARASILRALRADPDLITREDWVDIAAYGDRMSAGCHFSTPTTVPGIVENVGRRNIERPIGANAEMLSRIVGRCHVADSILTVARAVRRSLPAGRLRTFPVPFRRGLWQTAAEMHGANRSMYRDVMGHDPLPSPAAVANAVGMALGLGPCP